MVLSSAAFRLDIGNINYYTLHGKNMIQSFNTASCTGLLSQVPHIQTTVKVENNQLWKKVTLSEILATRVDMTHARNA